MKSRMDYRSKIKPEIIFFNFPNFKKYIKIKSFIYILRVFENQIKDRMVSFYSFLFINLKIKKKISCFIFLLREFYRKYLTEEINKLIKNIGNLFSALFFRKFPLYFSVGKTLNNNKKYQKKRGNKFYSNLSLFSKKSFKFNQKKFLKIHSGLKKNLFPETNKITMPNMIFKGKEVLPISIDKIWIIGLKLYSKEININV